MNSKTLLQITLLLSLFSSCTNEVTEESVKQPTSPLPVVVEDTIQEKIIEVPEQKDTLTNTYIFAGNKKFVIKVVEYNHNEIRYYCWNKPKSTNQKPDLILTKGEIERQGMQGGYIYSFTNAPYNYVIENWFMSETDEGMGVFLKVYQNEKEIVNSKFVEVEDLYDPAYTTHLTTPLKTTLITISDNWDNSINRNSNRISDIGVRGRYEVLKGQLGITVLENLFDEKIYKLNPHENGMDYYSMYFGRYNDKFLSKLYMELSELYFDEEFVEGFQALYDSQLKHYLRSYYLAYIYAANKEEYIYNSDQETFRAFADNAEKQGLDWYESNVCASFWVRRSIDGTSNHFFKILSLTLETFDKVFFHANKINERELLKNIDPNQFATENAC